MELFWILMALIFIIALGLWPIAGLIVLILIALYSLLLGFVWLIDKWDK